MLNFFLKKFFNTQKPQQEEKTVLTLGSGENSLLSFTIFFIPSFSHQVDKIVDQLQQLMQVYDLAALRDYWSYLERRLFSRLEDMYRPTINKLKTSLFRFYLVYTIQVLTGSAIP